jgi:hypothetical protein
VVARQPHPIASAFEFLQGMSNANMISLIRTIPGGRLWEFRRTIHSFSSEEGPRREGICRKNRASPCYQQVVPGIQACNIPCSSHPKNPEMRLLDRKLSPITLLLLGCGLRFGALIHYSMLIYIYKARIKYRNLQ